MLALNENWVIGHVTCFQWAGVRPHSTSELRCPTFAEFLVVRAYRISKLSFGS